MKKYIISLTGAIFLSTLGSAFLPQAAQAWGSQWGHKKSSVTEKRIRKVCTKHYGHGSKYEECVEEAHSVRHEVNETAKYLDEFTVPVVILVRGQRFVIRPGYNHSQVRSILEDAIGHSDGRGIQFGRLDPHGRVHSYRSLGLSREVLQDEWDFFG